MAAKHLRLQQTESSRGFALQADARCHVGLAGLSSVVASPHIMMMVVASPPMMEMVASPPTMVASPAP